MSTIEVDGKKFKVTENLGYQGGHYVKAVETPDGERIAVRRGFEWTWWTALDRGVCRREPTGASGSEKGGE